MNETDKFATLIRPIQATRLSQVAADQIVDLIEAGHFKVGDMLPNERTLVQQLGVSRASVREALRELEQQGWIEVRAGKGSFVTNSLPPSNLLPGLKAWFDAHRDEIVELINVRETLETYAASLSAINCSPADTDKMRELLVEMTNRANQNDLARVTNLDREFHCQIFALSGNQFLHMLGESLVTTVFGPRHSLLRLYPDVHKSITEHQAIVEAIAARDPDAAEAAVRLHMSGVRQVLQRMRNDASQHEKGDTPSPRRSTTPRRP